MEALGCTDRWVWGLPGCAGLRAHACCAVTCRVGLRCAAPCCAHAKPPDVTARSRGAALPALSPRTDHKAHATATRVTPRAPCPAPHSALHNLAVALYCLAPGEEGEAALLRHLTTTGTLYGTPLYDTQYALRLAQVGGGVSVTSPCTCACKRACRCRCVWGAACGCGWVGLGASPR
jgi:hypothetical protein